MTLNFIRMKYRHINILILLLLVNSLVLFATDFPEWLVPDDAKEVTNPLDDTKKIIDQGEVLFKTQCVACHGAGAKGDGVIPSANLTSKKFLDQTDGEIHYKIVNGRGVMPAFKALPDNDVWKIIYYIRSLTGVTENTNLKAGVINMSLDNNQVNVKFSELVDGKEYPASDIKVGVYVKRYFGLLPLFEGSLYTGNDGNVSVACPDNIIGDNEGNLTIVAKIEDSGFNPNQTQENINWGVIRSASDWDNTWQNDKELWRTNDMAPWWIKLSFLFISLGVWAGIFYVALQVRKIKKLSA